MAHFGITKRKPYYQFERKLFFFDPSIPDDDLEIYPGIPSGEFAYFVVDWYRYEIKDLRNAFKVFRSPRKDAFRVILPAQNMYPIRAYLSIDYPEYIDLFIDDRITARNYAYKSILITLEIED